jgi:hypothetical protein
MEHVPEIVSQISTQIPAEHSAQRSPDRNALWPNERTQRPTGQLSKPSS